jgi:hypothetical protein
MASTHNPNEAYLYADYMTKNLKLSNVRYEILDEAKALIWNAAPWSWTVQELDTLTLAPSTVDYTISTTGIHSLYRATLVSNSDSGDAAFKPLRIEPLLEASPIAVGETIAVSIAATNTIRVYKKPPSSLPSTGQKILLKGKKTYTPITSANYATTNAHELDDRWWHVYKCAVLVQAYKYADDDRGFAIQYEGKDRSFKMGQELALLQHYLDEMRKKEPMPFEWETYVDKPADER